MFSSRKKRLSGGRDGVPCQSDGIGTARKLALQRTAGIDRRYSQSSGRDGARGRGQFVFCYHCAPRMVRVCCCFPGTLTNYLDIGAATNTLSRFYRARLAL